MNSGITIISVLAVFFIATLIRSAFGFGEALVAVPLLALLIPVTVAVPVAVLVSITVAGLVLIQDWREVHVTSAWRLVLSTLLGTPFGLLLLTTVSERFVKAVLAVVIITFAVLPGLGGQPADGWPSVPPVRPRRPRPDRRVAVDPVCVGRKLSHVNPLVASLVAKASFARPRPSKARARRTGQWQSATNPARYLTTRKHSSRIVNL